jgi:hypothetical protein
MKLYPRVDSQDIHVDDVIHVIQNLDEFLAPTIKDKDKLPLSTISMRLTPWMNNSNQHNSYFSMVLLVDLNNIQDFGLRIVDGYFCNFNHDVLEGDGFADIKTDIESLKLVVEDLKIGNILLHNRCNQIDYNQYPYIIRENA